MFCRMGSLHVCRPQGRYGRGQNGPWRSCISCEWLKACVLPLFSLPRFSPECCILVAFVSLHSHLNNAFCERKIMTDYCSELTVHRRSFCNLRDVSKTNGVSLMTNVFTITADFSQWFLAWERCWVRNGCELWIRWVCALFVVFRVSRDITSSFCCWGLGLKEGLQDIHKDSWFCVSLPQSFSSLLSSFVLLIHLFLCTLS